MKFTHLHLHSDYSSLDSLCQIEALIKKVKECGHDSCVISDHGTLSGCFKFNELCKKEGIKPILGMEAYYCNDIAEKVFPSHITILAQNKIGWKNLLKLSFFGNSIGFYYKPRISWDKLVECSEGLIVLSGCLSSHFSKIILSGEDCSEEIRKFQNVFGKKFFIEINKHGIEQEKIVNAQLLLISKKFGIKCVATNDVHYLEKQHFRAHEIIMCVSSKTELSNPDRMKLPVNEFYYKSTDEMLIFHDPEHINNSSLIADMVESDLIEKQTSVLPVYPKQEIERRINSFAGKHQLSINEIERVKNEMEVINSANLQSYFLMVADYVNYANSNGMYVGPGRGSVSGSLVAYLLGIHSINPLKYGLLFSRFYNKGRSGSLPDIDIDFSLQDIANMRHHMEDEYGKDHVAVIGTLNTMSAKAAIKAVARILEIPFTESNLFTKSLEDESIEDCLNNPKLREIYEKDKKWKGVIDLALTLENNIYSESIHAAGIVVSQIPLTDIVPCRIDKKTGMLITCWDMKDLESLGLLKFDFLSLSTLDIIQETLNEVGIESYHKLPLNDKKAYQELCKGNTVGVFQLGSDGITKLTKQVKPKSIEDLGVIVALYRPGPLGSGLDQKYVARKFGKQKIKYKHPNLEGALKETHGVFCIEENSLISMADGTLKKIKDISIGDRVISVNLKNKKTEIKKCIEHGKTRSGVGFNIKLSNGLEIILTGDHKIFTYYGMKEVKYLDIKKDCIAIPNGIEVECNKEPIADWLGENIKVAYLLGQLTGDGDLTGSSIILCSGTEKNTDQLKSWIEKNIPKIIPTKYFNCRSWYLTFKTRELVNDHQNYSHTKKKFIKLLEDINMRYRTCYNKEIPNIIFLSDAETKLSYIAGLFDSDGHIGMGSRGTCVCSYCSVSGKLIKDLSYLLQGFGIENSIKKNRCHVYDSEKLQKLISPYLILRKFNGKHSNGKLSSVVPKEEITNYCKMHIGNIGQRIFSNKIGVSRSTLFREQHGKFVSVGVAEKCCIKNDLLKFYKIISIEKIDNQNFYGITVQDNHNLIANGIIIKNCYQEQITKTLVDLAGFNEHEADGVRKIMGKKLGDDAMAKVGKDFIDRCVKRNISIDIAKSIWKEMQHFSGYAFNKCISGETIIYRGNNDNGNDKPSISHLFKIKNNKEYAIKCNQKNLYKKLRRWGYGEILALDSDNRIRPKKIKDIIFSGVKKTYTITLSNGLSVRATEDHKFFTTNGFVKVKDIKISSTYLILDWGYEKTDFNTSNKFSKKTNSWKVKEYNNPQMGFDFGKNNPAYTNGAYTEFEKSKTRLSNINRCQKCGMDDVKLGHHHIDGNRENSILKNIEKLCKSCHAKSDYNLGKRKKRWSKGHKTSVATVISIEYFGEEETYDIEMDFDGHNFIANGIVSSNSHAISYAHLTYYTSYLKNKFPAQFMCACLNSALGDKEKISKFLREANRLGVEVKPININISRDLFTSDGESIYCGFSVIKQVGFGTEDKIYRRNLLDFFTKSSISSRAIINIILCGGLDHVNSNRNAMLKYYEKIKLVKIKDERFTLFSPYEHIKIPDVPEMTVKEKIKIEFELIGHIISVDIFKLSWFTNNLVDYSYIEHCVRTGGKIKLGGIATDFNKFVTKKTQRTMAVFNLYAKDYTIKTVCFPDQFQQYSDRLYDGNLVSIVGNIKEEDESLTVFIEYVNNIF